MGGNDAKPLCVIYVYSGDPAINFPPKPAKTTCCLGVSFSENSTGSITNFNKHAKILFTCKKTS